MHPNTQALILLLTLTFHVGDQKPALSMAMLHVEEQPSLTVARAKYS
jgi:hypothetical protein